MKSTRRWAQAIAFRIKIAGAAWLTTGFSLIALGWAFFVPLPHDAELRLRIIGTTLQGGSIIAVGIGIGRARKRLGKLSVWHAIAGYFATLFRYPKDYRLDAECGNISLEGVALSAFGSTHAPAATQRTPEERLSNVETLVETLTGKLHALEGKLVQETAARERALAEERGARAQEQQEQRRMIDELQTADVLVTLVGLVWLLLGIVLASVPDLLAFFAVAG